SNRLRNEVFRLGRFEVVDRGMMENILAEQDFQQTGCTSNDCLVEVGRLLGAQRMVGGSISKVGGTFTVSARLVDVETGKVLSVSDFDLRGELDDLLTRGMREVAMKLSAYEVAIQEEGLEETTAPNLPVDEATLQRKEFAEVAEDEHSVSETKEPVTLAQIDTNKTKELRMVAQIDTSAKKVRAKILPKLGNNMFMFAYAAVGVWMAIILLVGR
ncbi:MAG: DUF2380 domain-containing protein, partial [Candidatus Marinimicrobia bacterium]|nr:DUF2380 domain-containing protein [Candidatus Neomarinimicrobiota bacterium]